MLDPDYIRSCELYKLCGYNKNLLKAVFYCNDYGVPYKTITLYPVKVKFYYFFHLLAQCLLVPHRTSGDIKAIQMSYLKYLCYLAKEKNQPEYIVELSELLLLVLQKDKTYVNENGETLSTLEILLDEAKIKIEGNIFDEKDFDFIREVILEQNAIEMPDETINPALVKAYREIEEFKRKQCHNKMCSYEDELNVVVAISSYKRQEILEMTIRSFDRLFKRANMIINYQIQCAQAPYMNEKDQKQIKHYLFDDEKTLRERIDAERTDLDSLKKKIK